MSEHTARPRPSSNRWCIFCDRAPCDGTTRRCDYRARLKHAATLSEEAAFKLLAGHKKQSEELMQQHAKVGLMGGPSPAAPGLPWRKCSLVAG